MEVSQGGKREQECIVWCVGWKQQQQQKKEKEEENSKVCINRAPKKLKAAPIQTIQNH